MAPSGPPGASLAGLGGSEPGFAAPHAPLPGPRLVLLSPVLLTPRQGTRPGRSNWQNNSDRAALPRARPSPAGASLPAAETNSHNTPNKSSELRPPESLAAAGSAPPEPARTVSDRGSLCRAVLLLAPARTASCSRGAQRGGRCPAPPDPLSLPVAARSGPAPGLAHRPSLRARPHLSRLPPARPPLTPSGAANQNFFFLPELLSRLPGGRSGGAGRGGRAPPAGQGLRPTRVPPAGRQGARRGTRPPAPARPSRRESRRGAEAVGPGPSRREEETGPGRPSAPASPGGTGLPGLVPGGTKRGWGRGRRREGGREEVGAGRAVLRAFSRFREDFTGSGGSPCILRVVDPKRHLEGQIPFISKNG